MDHFCFLNISSHHFSTVNFLNFPQNWEICNPGPTLHIVVQTQWLFSTAVLILSCCITAAFLQFYILCGTELCGIYLKIEWFKISFTAANGQTISTTVTFHSVLKEPRLASVAQETRSYVDVFTCVATFNGNMNNNLDQPRATVHAYLCVFWGGCLQKCLKR